MPGKIELLESRDLLATDVLSGVFPPARSSNPRNVTAIDDEAYFWVDADLDPSRSLSSLYRTDGTAQGTQPVGSNGRRATTVVGNKLVFRTADGLYATSSGESPVFLTEGIAVRSGPVAYAGKAYFVGRRLESSGRTDWDVMVTDGTPTGTDYIADVPNSNRDIQIQGVFADRLYVIYRERLLVETDGSLDGTSIVEIGGGDLSDVSFEASLGNVLIGFNSITKKLVLFDQEASSWAEVELDLPRFASSLQFLETPERVYFATNGQDVWTTDGTSGGTKKVADFGRLSTPTSSLTWFQDQLFFSADNRIWTYDPQLAELKEFVRFPQIAPLPPSLGPVRHLGPNGFTHYNDDLIFTANSEEFGYELWITNGTASGTKVLYDVWPGRGDSLPSDLSIWGDKLLFAAELPEFGNELWMLDLLDVDLEFLGDLQRGYDRGRDLVPLQLQEFNDFGYFALDDDIHGTELWLTDGTTGNTRMLKDIDEGGEGWIGDVFAKWNDRLFFLADDGVHGRELWSTDGTETGTRLEFDLVEGEGSGFHDRNNRPLLATSTGILLQLDNSLLQWNGSELNTVYQPEQLPAEDTFHTLFEVDNELILVGNSVYRFSKQSGRYEPVPIEDGTNVLEVVALPDRSGLVVKTPQGLSLLDLTTSMASPIADIPVRGLTVRGDYVLGWSTGASGVSRLLRWRSGEWEQEEVAQGVLQYDRVGINDENFYVLDQRLITLDDQAEVITLIEFESSLPSFAEVIALQNRFLYTGRSPSTGKRSLLSVPFGAGTIDQEHVDDLYSAVFQNTGTDASPRLDFNRDGSVDETDVDFVFDSVLETGSADLDLNGSVDFADFLALSRNFGKTTANWSEGDVSGNGSVDFADFLILSSMFSDAPELTEITLGDRLLGELGPRASGEIDEYRIDAKAGNNYRIDAVREASPITVDVGIQLVDGEGNLLEQETGGRLDWTAQFSGTHIVRVFGVASPDGWSSDITYSIRISNA